MNQNLIRAGTSSALVLAIVLLGLNLRPVLAAVGPLLGMIQADTGMGHVSASLLTMLPVFVMGSVALAGSLVQRWLGTRAGITLGAACIALAAGLRAVAFDIPGLMLTALLAGAGIALVQALLPVVIKRAYGANSGRVMAGYSTAIMGGSAVAAVAAPRLAEWWSWPWAMGVWALPALAAQVVWRVVDKRTPLAVAVTAPAVAPSRPWRNRRAWSLAAFFGIGTGAYTLVLAWLPPYYQALGWSAIDSGLLLGQLTLAEVVSGLAVSLLIARFPDRRKPLAAALGFALVGLIGLVAAPLTLAWPVTLILGLGIGALFPLTLVVTLDHLDDPAQAGALMAFVQGVGYMLASLTPLAAGYLRERFADLAYAWVLMAVGTVVLMTMAWRYSPGSYRQMQAAPQG